MFESSSWFQRSDEITTIADADRQSFLRRHFWPPSALGIIVLSVVFSMVIGFIGAVIYTSSDNAKIAAIDPTDEARVAPTVPASAEPEGPTTTKPLEILTPENLGRKVAPSVWAVSTLDEAGRQVEGTAFVAGAFGGQTFMLTSLSIVRAATRIPGPEILVRNGNTEVKATLWTWQEDKDLALLVTGRAAASLPWPDDGPQAKPGDKVYLVAAGGGPIAGVLSAVSPASIQHNVFIDARRQGAPIFNERGQVLGMVSLALNPNGGQTDTTFYALPIASACEKVLNCGGGNASVPSTVAPTGLNATTSTTPTPTTTAR